MKLKYIKTETIIYFETKEKRKYRINLSQKNKTWEVCQINGIWLNAQNQKEWDKAMKLKYVKTVATTYFDSEKGKKYRVNLSQKDKKWEVCQINGTWLQAQNQKELEQAYLNFICAEG